MNFDEIRANIDDKLRIGRKVHHKIYATTKTGSLKLSESRVGKIEAVYPYIVAVRMSNFIECFSKSLFFSKGSERMSF